MKIQDIAFFIVVAVLLTTRNPRVFASAGLLCLFAAMPLFAFWVFFTAERLTWYAGAFFLFSVLFHIRDLRRVQ